MSAVRKKPICDASKRAKSASARNLTRPVPGVGRCRRGGGGGDAAATSATPKPARAAGAGDASPVPPERSASWREPGAAAVSPRSPPAWEAGARAARTRDELHEVYRNRNFAAHVTEEFPAQELEHVSRFRARHYLACHSASAVRWRGEGALREPHACTYSFYLNRRLFPTPTCGSEARCGKCALPRDAARAPGPAALRALARVSRELTEVTLLVPASEALLVRERRACADGDEELGVLELEPVAAPRLPPPHDSYALRYQRGYTQFSPRAPPDAAGVDLPDIIYI